METRAPNLTKLSTQTSTTLEELSRLYIGQGLGAALGAMLGGAMQLCCPLATDGNLALGTLLAAISVAGMAWCPEPITMGVAFTCLGTGAGIIKVVSLSSLILMLSDRRGVWMFHVLYISYAVGAGSVTSVHRVTTLLARNSSVLNLLEFLRPAPSHQQHPLAYTNGIQGFGAASTVTELNTTDKAISIQTTTEKTDPDIITAWYSFNPDLQLMLVCLAVGVVGVLICCAFFVLSCCSCYFCHYGMTFTELLSYESIPTKSLEKDRLDSRNGNNKNKNTKRNGHIPCSDDSTQTVIMTKYSLRPNGVLSASAESSVVHHQHPDQYEEFQADPEGAKYQIRWFQEGQTFGVAVQLYLYVYFAMGSGMMMVFSQFLYSFARQTFPEDSRVVFLIPTVYWGAVGLSRIVCILAAKLVHPNPIMLTCLFLNVISSGVMALYGTRYPGILWLFAGLFGCAVGPMVVGGLTWANVFFHLSAKSVALCQAFEAVGVTLFPWLCSFVVKHYGLRAMHVMTLITGILTFLLNIPVLIKLNRIKSFRYGKKTANRPPTSTYL